MKTFFCTLLSAVVSFVTFAWLNPKDEGKFGKQNRDRLKGLGLCKPNTDNVLELCKKVPILRARREGMTLFIDVHAGCPMRFIYDLEARELEDVKHFKQRTA